MKMLEKLFILMAVLILSLTMAFGCNDDDDDDDNDDNDTTVVCADLLTEAECVAESDCEWVAEEDDGYCTDATSTTDDDDDDDNDDGPIWEGAQEINLVTPDGVTTTIALYGMPVSTWTDAYDDDIEKTALSLQDYIDEALTEIGGSITAANYVYNFIGSDDWSILAEKLGGDPSGLPTYEQLDRGRVIEYDDDGAGDIRVRWDLGLNFSGWMAARMMNGGTIEMIEP